MEFVHGDDVDATRAKVREHRAQELRRDLEMTIGLEFGVAARANMVQHEDCADPCEDRSQQMMGPAEVKRSQSGTDDVVAKLLHAGVASRLGEIPKLTGDR